MFFFDTILNSERPYSHCLFQSTFCISGNDIWHESDNDCDFNWLALKRKTNNANQTIDRFYKFVCNEQIRRLWIKAERKRCLFCRSFIRFDHNWRWPDRSNVIFSAKLWLAHRMRDGCIYDFSVACMDLPSFGSLCVKRKRKKSIKNIHFPQNVKV